MAAPSFPAEKFPAPTNAAGLYGAPGRRDFMRSSGGTGSLGHSAISTSPTSIRSSAPSRNLISVTNPKLIGGGVIGSDCAQPSDEIEADYTEIERSLRAVLERSGYIQPDDDDFTVRAVFKRIGYIQPDDDDFTVVDQLSHRKHGGTGIRSAISTSPASVRWTLGEKQIKDLKLFGVDCPYTQSVADFPVTAFLERKGYLQPIDGGGVHDILSLSSAMKTYQLNHGLKATGFIDALTLSMMLGRRSSDIVDGVYLTRLHGGDASGFTLFPGGPILNHGEYGGTGIRSAISTTPASVGCIVLTENQVEDLKLFGGDCAYTQSVGDFPVTAFLEWTGYLKPIDSGGVHDVLSISSALKRYQLNHGLEDTGIIDVPTVSMMLSRRCGAPDIVDGLNLTRFHGGDASCFNVFPGGPKWENTNLTYHYYSSVPEAAKPAFKLAFAEWTRVRPEFTFTEVPAAGDIKISFCRGKHGSGDCLPFNGPGSVLAHSFAPCDGRLHVDESQFWSFRNIPNAAYFVDLESAVLHEIGHILGLCHSYDENAVMFPSLKPNEIKNRLTRDDIHGINFLYGKY